MRHDDFNRVTAFCTVCPVSRTDRGYPFHVPIPKGSGVDGVIMADQLRSLDHRARGAVRIGPAPAPVFDEVLALMDACLF